MDGRMKQLPVVNYFAIMFIIIIDQTDIPPLSFITQDVHDCYFPHNKNPVRWIELRGVTIQ